MIDKHHGWNASFRPSIIGFILSLIITVAIYRVVAREALTDTMLTLTVFGLGSVQVLVQLFFFLHLGMESKPHWNSITFLFMVLVTIVVIGGSVWIMQNLNYHVMPKP